MSLKVMPVLLAARVAIVRGGYRVVRDDERVVRTCGGFTASLPVPDAHEPTRPRTDRLLPSITTAVCLELLFILGHGKNITRLLGSASGS